MFDGVGTRDTSRLKSVVMIVLVATLAIPSLSSTSSLFVSWSKSQSSESSPLQYSLPQIRELFSVTQIATLIPSVPVAYASSSYDIESGDGNHNCEQIGGRMDVGDGICILQSNLILPAGSSLKIDSGITLQIPAAYEITNYGVINDNWYIMNWGNIINTGGGIINIYAYNTLNNWGTITNQIATTNNEGGTININSNAFFYNAKTINNSFGTISISNLGYLENEYTPATITNSGTITLYPVGVGGGFNGGKIDNYGIITNSLTINNFGTINNLLGTITNLGSGTITNSGAYLYNTGKINNMGNLIINKPQPSGTPNYTLYNANANIINSGYITINKGGVILNGGTSVSTITNSNTITNSGTINNYKTITNKVGGTISNLNLFYNNYGGIINNSGTITNNMVINNGGTLNNFDGPGTINNFDTINNQGTINNPAGATININGAEIVNTGIVNNSGIINESNGTISDNPVIGTAPIAIVPGSTPILKTPGANMGDNSSNGSPNTLQNTFTRQMQQPANLTSNGSASNVSQGGNQIAQQAGQGQNGIPLGSSYNAPASPQNQISTQVVYNDSDNPVGPLQGTGWAAGMVIVGVMSGIGVWTAVRRS